ncbi:MAG: hypothetical protein ACLQGP_03030 [Isosphaeraceae bacterium]
MTGPESAGLPPGRYRWVLEDDPVTGRHSRTRLYLARDLSTEALIRVRDAAAAELVRRDVCEHGVQSSEYCRPCNLEYKRARRDAYGDDGTGTGGRQ